MESHASTAVQTLGSGKGGGMTKNKIVVSATFAKSDNGYCFEKEGQGVTTCKTFPDSYYQSRWKLVGHSGTTSLFPLLDEESMINMPDGSISTHVGSSGPEDPLCVKRTNGVTLEDYWSL
ncbi:unnamed protein product [Allacma fusca]|uniref:Uncharacterized protein n=1 Tax=Allacma fusca TaxID=39272 RepID=A0A8J2KIY9_9HEXA|nr:unnamed protein product [Allacma fusca]